MKTNAEIAALVTQIAALNASLATAMAASPVSAGVVAGLKTQIATANTNLAQKKAQAALNTKNILANKAKIVKHKG